MFADLHKLRVITDTCHVKEYLLNRKLLTHTSITGSGAITNTQYKKCFFYANRSKTV